MEIAEAIKIKKEKEKENSNSELVEDNTYYKGIKLPDYILYIDLNGQRHLAESIEEFISLLNTDLNSPNCTIEFMGSVEEGRIALYKQPVETKYVINQVYVDGGVNIVETSRYREDFEDNLYSYVYSEHQLAGSEQDPEYQN